MNCLLPWLTARARRAASGQGLSERYSGLAAAMQGAAMLILTGFIP
ncbi:hypothetical protein BN1184_AA_01060 [Pantoea ananatis]|nr:hypothetical protein BN1184_AA_01060 [Pantoea ananatis]